jgi:hypothetical protein
MQPCTSSATCPLMTSRLVQSSFIKQHMGSQCSLLSSRLSQNPSSPQHWFRSNDVLNKIAKVCGMLQGQLFMVQLPHLHACWSHMHVGFG